MPDYAVSTTFLAKDNVTSAFENMAKGAGRFSAAGNAAFRNIERGANNASSAAKGMGSTFGGVFKGIMAASIVRRGISLVGSGIGNVVGDFIEFDHAMTGAAARFDDIGPKAVNFSGKLGLLKEGVRDAIAGTQFTAVDAAMGMDSLAKAGFSSRAALGVLRSEMELTAATGGDFQTTLQQSNELLGAFGMRTKGVSLNIANQAHLNDVLGAAANAANGDLTDLYEALKMAAPVARINNAAMEDVIAMAVALENAGIRGSEGATAMKNAILNVNSAAVQSELMANGIDIRIKGTNNLRPISAILGDISGKLKSLGNIEQAQILNRIFGKRAIAGAKGLMDNLETLSLLEKQMHNVSGANREMSDVMSQSTKNQLLKLGNTVLDKGFQVLDAFSPDGKSGIDFLTKSIKEFDMKPVIEGLKMAGNVAGKLWDMVKPFVPYLPQFVAGWVLMSGALKVVELGKGAYAIGTVINTMAKGLGTVDSMSTAMSALGASLTAVATPLKLITAFGVGYGLGKLINKVLGIENGEFGSWIYDKVNKNDSTAPGGGQQHGAAESIAKASEARQLRFQGLLNIAGAPAGSTYENTMRGVPTIDVMMLGANP